MSLRFPIPKLKKVLPIKDPTGINKVLLAIDHLNDLEHNNDMFLTNYVTFNLYKALESKLEFPEDYIFDNATPALRKYRRQYERQAI